MVEVIEHCGGTIGVDQQVVTAQLNTISLSRLTASNVQYARAVAQAKETYLSCAFLLMADRFQYEKLVENLENDFMQGRDNYPCTLTSAYLYIVNWKQNPQYLLRMIEGPTEALAFVNAGNHNQDQAKDKSGVQC